MARPGSRSGSASSPYGPAANLLSQIIDDKKSFKKLVYSKDGSLRCSKVTYAQVCQVLSYKTILDQILKKVPSLSNDVHNTGLLRVLIYELLLGPNKAVRGGGAVKRKLLQHEKQLKEALQDPEVSQQLQAFEAQKQQHCFPRYARINTLWMTVEEVCTALLKQQDNETNNDDDPFEFYVDPHVPDLLVLPPSIITETMKDESDSQVKGQEQRQSMSPHENIKSWIQTGKIILQDKSSCFSALCLVHGFDRSPPSEQHNQDFLDACAAPGNKTQHLAALLGSSSTIRAATTIYALDRSEERLALLQHRMEQLVPDDHQSGIKVLPKECDFLETDPKEYPLVGSILLDPSCSGSGIVTAPDRWAEGNASRSGMEDGEVKRVESLAKFQEKALTHAMSYPNVTRIVYSTCSVHERENEEVVIKARATGAEKGHHWRIISPKCLDGWERRGREVEGLSADDAQCMIRACSADETNGFFVCCLERVATTLKNDTRHKEKPRSPVSEVVVPKGAKLYLGQFATRKMPEEKKCLSLSQSRPDILEKKLKSGVDKKEVRELSSSTPNTATGEPDAKQLPKKIAKKLAWKKRQMEEKQTRLQQKKQKM